MRRTLISLLAATTLLWPLGAIAAPAAVLGVEATIADGKIRVSWHTPKRADDIVKYRIYFSHESILSNEGNFDDTVTIENKDTSYTFESAPPYEKVFFTVVGVDASDVESPAFGNEASIDVPSQADSSSVSAAAEESSSSANEAPASESSSSAEAPAEGLHDSAPANPGVTNVFLSSQSTGNTYTITATFDLPSELDVSSFDVLQSIDGGKTFGSTQTVAGTTRRVQFEAVPPGIFGVLIRAHLTDGNYARSVFASLPLAGVRPAYIAPITQGKHPLTNTGAGLTLVFAASGAMMGWRKARKLKAAAH